MAHTHSTPTQTSDSATSPAALHSAFTKVVSPTPDMAEAMARGYEPKDIGLRGVFVFLGTLVASLFVVTLVIYGIMMALVVHDRSKDAQASPLTVATPLLTTPPLQPSLSHENLDVGDMKEMRQVAEATLSSTGVSGPYGRRHLKIDDAKTMAVGLINGMKPAAPTTKPTAAFNTPETPSPVASNRN